MSDTDATPDLSDKAPFVRARRGRVMIELRPIAVQSENAANLLGTSVEILHRVPFSILPYRRNGTHRWYLVRLIDELCEKLMAEQIARGEPAHLERFGARVIPHIDDDRRAAS